MRKKRLLEKQLLQMCHQQSNAEQICMLLIKIRGVEGASVECSEVLCTLLPTQLFAYCSCPVESSHFVCKIHNTSKGK
ncbi:hypothetical protein ACLKA7_004472 [Drosophila subpalustris]